MAASVVEAEADAFPDLEGYALLVRAHLRRLERSQDEAVELLGCARRTFARERQERAEAASLLAISNIDVDVDTALAAARRSLELFERAGDDLGAGEARLNIGVLLTHRGDPELAMGELRRSNQLLVAAGDEYGSAIALLNLASSLTLSGRFESALMTTNECIETLNRLNGSDTGECSALAWQTSGWAEVSVRPDYLFGTALNNKGNILAALGDLDAALDAYLAGRDHLSRSGDRAGEAMILNQLGDLYRERGDYDHAEEYFELSRATFESIGEHGYRYGTVLQGLGETRAARGERQRARESFEAALAEFRGDSYAVGEATVTMLLGELAAAGGETAESIELLTTALTRARTISAADVVVRTNLALASALLHTDSTRAREHLMQALLLAEEHGMKVEQQNIHRQLSAHYKLVGDTALALSHFEKYHELRQSIHSESAERRLQNFAIIHKVEQYRQSLAAMASRVEQVERELEAKTAELASLAERIMEKQEFVRMVEEGLTRLLAAHRERKDDVARDLLEAIRRVGDVRGDWSALTEKFLSIHREFAERLLEVAPNITPAELHVCVLLRLSMGAKQIAEVLKVEPKTVFHHQQSIRRKLQLVNRENLKSYLLRLEAA